MAKHRRDRSVDMPSSTTRAQSSLSRRRWRGVGWTVAALGSIVTLTVAGVGVAYAQWTSHGSGTGATTTSGGGATLRATGTVRRGMSLVPGRSADLVLDIDNLGDRAVTVTGLALDRARRVRVHPGRRCAHPTLTVSTPKGWPGIEVPARRRSGPMTIPHAVTLRADAPNGCQGVTITIPLALLGHSS